MSADAESKMLFVEINQRGIPGVPEQARRGSKVEFACLMTTYLVAGKSNGLVNLLANDLNMGHGYAERITVAWIHAEMWRGRDRR